jgi:hypothetical protein
MMVGLILVSVLIISSASDESRKRGGLTTFMPFEFILNILQHITSNDPLTAPIIDPGFLTSDFGTVDSP